MFLIKNYNRFIVNRDGTDKWEDFYIHRHASDLIFCKLFPTEYLAEKFIKSNSHLFDEYEAWIVPIDPEDWLKSGTVTTNKMIREYYIPLFDKLGISCSISSRTVQST